MIGRLHGTVVEKHTTHLTLDVNGVGYEVETPLPTFYKVTVGQATTLWTHLVVREDAHLLYGFSDREERALFRLLLKVSGVGPKLALGLLSGMEPGAFLHCIQLDDVTTLTKIPGVGKKTAERLVIELRDRIKELRLPVTPDAAPADRLTLTSPLSPVAEAEQALIALGYKPLEAQKAINAVKNKHEDTANLIRAALKAMVK